MGLLPEMAVSELERQEYILRQQHVQEKKCLALSSHLEQFKSDNADKEVGHLTLRQANADWKEHENKPATLAVNPNWVDLPETSDNTWGLRVVDDKDEKWDERNSLVTQIARRRMYFCDSKCLSFHGAEAKTFESGEHVRPAFFPTFATLVPIKVWGHPG